MNPCPNNTQGPRVLITVLGQNKCPEAVGGAGVGTEINFQQLKRGYEEEELKSELI